MVIYILNLIKIYIEQKSQYHYMVYTLCMSELINILYKYIYIYIHTTMIILLNSAHNHGALLVITKEIDH